MNFLHRYFLLLSLCTFFSVGWMLLAQPAEKGKQAKASEVQTSKEPKNKVKAPLNWDYHFSQINDLQNGGLTLGQDDRYTYGLNTALSLENWHLELDYRALTDRYASATRIDTLSLALSYTLGNLLGHLGKTPFYLSAELKAGLFSAGDLGGQILQNNLHELIGDIELSLEYLPAFSSMQNQLRIFFAYGRPFKLARWREADWQLGLFAEQELIWGYRERFAGGLSARFSSGTSFYKFDVFFQQMAYWQGRANNDAEALWQNTSTAFWWHFSTRFGFYQRNLYVSFGSLLDASSYAMGYGSMEFSISSIGKKKKFVEADAFQSILFGLNDFWVHDRFAFRFLEFPLSLGLSAIRQMNREYLDENTLERTAYYMLFADLEPSLSLNKLGFLDFYLGLGTGVALLERSSAPYNVNKHRQFPFWALGAEMGVRWYGLQLRQEGVAYGLEASMLLVWPTQDVPRLSFMLGLVIMADF